MESGMFDMRTEDQLVRYGESTLLTATEIFRRAGTTCRTPGNTATLLLSTPIPYARKGALAAITQFLVRHSGSIVHADDHINSGLLENEVRAVGIAGGQRGEDFEVTARIRKRIARTGHNAHIRHEALTLPFAAQSYNGLRTVIPTDGLKCQTGYTRHRAAQCQPPIGCSSMPLVVRNG